MKLSTLLFCIPLLAMAQPKPGTKAPELQLEHLFHKSDSSIPTLSSLKGRIVVLDFWATWCSPCVAAFPENNEMYRQFSDKVTFIAITDDVNQHVETFLKKVQVEFMTVKDHNRETFNSYGVTSIPQMIIINTEGIIVYRGHHITKELLGEVIRTNSVSPTEFIEQKNLPIHGSFAPGEDPLYNGVRESIMGSEVKSPPLIEQFIIRPSLENTLFGCGYRTTQDGHVGVTFSGGQLNDILKFALELPTTLRVKNNTADSTRYDIVYWKIPDGVEGNELELAKNEIIKTICTGLHLTINRNVVTTEVYLISASTRNEWIKREDELEPGAEKAYSSLYSFAEQLENKSGKYYIVDDSLNTSYIHNKGMEWKKMVKADPTELTSFLESRGLTIKPTQRTITLFELNRN